MKRFVVLAALLLLSANMIFSVDFGLLMDHKFDAGRLEDGNNFFTYNPGLTPWFSWNSDKGMSLYLSTIFSLKYLKSDDGDPDNDGLRKPSLLFEVGRFSFSYRAAQRYSIEVGRIWYTDALEQTASGLFDGFSFEKPFSKGTLSTALFYTGLQYKETAKIIMTPSDAVEYGKTYEEAGDYFASKRLFAIGRWDMPLKEYHNLSLEALFQFDLNGNEESLHSQYAQAQFDFFTQKKLGISAGVMAETMEVDGDFGFAFGALFGLSVDMPGSLNDGLKFTSKFSSGNWNDTFIAYTPISALDQGNVFPGTFSGLWVNRINYDVRILPSLFAGGALSYFVRTSTDSEYEGNLYGGEIWLSLAWQPLDDIRVYFGGGVFLPALGNAYPSDTDTMWKISGGFSMSF